MQIGNALYKTELVRGLGREPWRTIGDFEFATLGGVHLNDHEPLHSDLGDVPLVDFEAVYDADSSAY